ncbi:MAG: PH domain-containing protein [Lactobacillaceae bacterium]|jgi:membrane protein YdbS with pleckstrin-like domain|nr:PH domain-containing protein [Lactobacillaceae bacterium]
MLNLTGTQLPESVKKLWLIRRMFWTIPAIIGLIVFLIFKQNQIVLYVTGVITFLVVVTLVAQLLLIPYHYKFFRYSITDTAVVIQKGFFFRKEDNIPLSRVQNVDLEQGPIMRPLNLENIVIVTSADSFTIDGLTSSTADGLRDTILEFAGKNAHAN